VLDARTDQLRHQRATLPVIAEIAALQTSRADLDDQARDARIVVDDLTAEQTKIDADVEQVRTRRTRDQDRMDQGLIANPKDLERMQHELESLQRRITSLEDDELEIMAQVEDAQRNLDELEAHLRQADERLVTLAEERDRRLAELDAELLDLEAQRGPVVEALPTDLLTLYDRLREQKDGVGAAELRARQCGGCRLTVDNAELAVIRAKPEDVVIRCEECQRILVRTPESGL
jgi:predicted  nucleic acid-binding Zn-ribbon protein